MVKMYKMCKNTKEDKGNFETANCLNLIEETENILNKMFEDFNFIKSRFPEKYHLCTQELKQKKRKEYRDKNDQLLNKLRNE